MTTPLFQLGSFVFSSTTGAPDELARSTRYQWESQQRIGAGPHLTYGGTGTDELTIAGVMFAELTGSIDLVEQLRTEAAAGVPLDLVMATGDALGRWVILSVDEIAGAFIAGAIPRRQAYTLKLQRFTGDDG